MFQPLNDPSDLQSFDFPFIAIRHCKVATKDRTHWCKFIVNIDSPKVDRVPILFCFTFVVLLTLCQWVWVCFLQTFVPAICFLRFIWKFAFTSVYRGLIWLNLRWLYLCLSMLCSAAFHTFTAKTRTTMVGVVLKFFLFAWVFTNNVHLFWVEQFVILAITDATIRMVIRPFPQ